MSWEVSTTKANGTCVQRLPVDWSPGRLFTMKTKPKLTVVAVTDEEALAEVQAWEDSHLGYDRTNYVDYFRDETGELIETDGFFRAAQMYSELRAADKTA